MSSFSFTRYLFLIYGASLRNVGNANKRLVNDTVSHRLFLPWRQNRQIIAERGCTAFNTHWSIAQKHSSGENPCSRRAFTGQISSNNRTRNPGDQRTKPSCVSRCQKPPGVSKSCTGRTGARYQAYIEVRVPGGEKERVFRGYITYREAPLRGPAPSRPPYLQLVPTILSKLLFSFTAYARIETSQFLSPCNPL